MSHSRPLVLYLLSPADSARMLDYDQALPRKSLLPVTKLHLAPLGEAELVGSWWL